MPPSPAMYWRGQELDYAQFFDLIDGWDAHLDEHGVGRGTVTGVLGDYSPQACALLFALMRRGAILVPYTYAIEPEIPKFSEIAGVERLFRFDADDAWEVEAHDVEQHNHLVESFRELGKPGLIVFTSGSTGEPKGILHDCERVMRKFVTPRPGWRTVLFLMMDHFGGFNTLMSAFAYGGMAIAVPDRNPETVSQVVQDSQATLLPTTPTFLNLLVASGTYRAFDLSSVKMVSYGTEVMPEATLDKLAGVFPNAQLKQTYGLSELGVLRSKSEKSDSAWVKVGGDGFEVKVVDGLLWVRSEANMVGYLNAPSPFDDEGWMCTGDHVEVRGELMRILGRKSEMINVGGQKVLPVEVETVLLEADNVAEAAVFGAKHPLMGQVVHAKLSLHEPEEARAVAGRLRKFCLERMASYKMPVKFEIVAADEQRSDRFKKLRGPV